MAEITLSQITEGTVAGTGVFDLLMGAAAAHLQQEYNLQRIRGADYATLYTQTIQAVMGQSIQFVLSKQLSDKQAELVQTQIDKAVHETAILVEQLVKLQNESSLVRAQVGKVEADIAYSTAQLDKVVPEIALISAQTAKVERDTLFIGEQAAKLLADIEQTEKATLNTVTQNALITAQISKTAAENAILVQKKFTEEAQIQDTVNGAEVQGVIGKQKTLYAAQTSGFTRDAEYKIAKLLVDTWAVRRTTDQTGTLADDINKLNDASIGSVITKVKQGIGV